MVVHVCKYLLFQELPASNLPRLWTLWQKAGNQQKHIRTLSKKYKHKLLECPNCIASFVDFVAEHREPEELLYLNTLKENTNTNS